MESWLTDLGDDALGTAAERNLRAFIRKMASTPTLHAASGDRWIRWRSRLPHPWFTGLMVERPAAPSDALLLGATVAEFGNQGWSFWATDEADLASWLPLAEGTGLVRDLSIPQMGMATAALAANEPLPGDFAIVKVETRATMADWSKTFCEGYEIPLRFLPRLESLFVEMGTAAPFAHWLGLHGGAPVATASTLVSDGVVGLYNVATKPALRGNGYATAMTRAAIRVAAALGAPAAVLQSSPQGTGLYKRLGFRHLGNVEQWLHPDTA
ncbi:MAG: GNAT family N-acetyltransferase [Armatimonadota bacterium]